MAVLRLFDSNVGNGNSGIDWKKKEIEERDCGQ